MKTKIVIIGSDTEHGQWLESFFGRQPDYDIEGVPHNDSWNIRKIVDEAQTLFFVLEDTKGITPDVIKHFAEYCPSPEKIWVDVGPIYLPRTEINPMPFVEFASMRFDCPESVDANLDGGRIRMHIKQISAMTIKFTNLTSTLANQAGAAVDFLTQMP